LLIEGGGKPMTMGERWLRRPQSAWPRKALFQIHLWTGIGAGLYVLAISLTGSAIVFRNELYDALWSGPKVVEAVGEPLSRDELKAKAEETHSEYRVSFIWPAKQPNVATEIWLNRGEDQKQRLFDPYTGEDLGASRPASIGVLKWLADLHVDLLAGTTGRVVNGVGAIFVTLLSLTGLVIWWPGIQNWRRSLTIRRGVGWKRFNWDLHSAAGAWTLAFVFLWGITGVELVFPAPFYKAVDAVAPLEFYREVPEEEEITEAVPAAAQVDPGAGGQRFRPRRSLGDNIIRGFSSAHFGTFGGWPVKALWTLLGLAPAFLFVTGLLMWWNRVIRQGVRRGGPEPNGG
jgi:uncharacterized iron-regulated membrane protein